MNLWKLDFVKNEPDLCVNLTPNNWNLGWTKMVNSHAEKMSFQNTYFFYWEFYCLAEQSIQSLQISQIWYQAI